MKYNYYIVTFKTGKTVFVRCFTEEEAKILSQAIMIKECFRYEIESIEQTQDTYMQNKTDYVSW